VTAAASTSRRLGLLQVCLAGVLWGTGGLAVQVIRHRSELSVLTISAYRMAIAALVLGVVVAAARRFPELRAVLRDHPGPVVLMGLSTAAYQALYFSAVVWVGVSVSTVVSLGLAPLLITAWESLRARALPHPTQLAVLGAALAGLVLVTVSTDPSSASPHPTWGLLASMLSGTGYAVTTLLGRRLAQGTNPLALTTGATLVGACALVPCGLASGLTGTPLTSGNLVVLGTLLYLGVLTMALAYGLLYAGLRTVTGSAAVIATLVEPVTAAALAAVLLDERLGPAGVVGAALILLAVGGLHRTPTPTAVPPG
jgi:DME family drug/metabolite transporter